MKTRSIVPLFTAAALLATGLSPDFGSAADREGDPPAENANRTAPEANRGKRDEETKPGGPRDGDAPKARPANSKQGKVFAAYDKDRDGLVTAKEIEAMMEGRQNSRGRREIRKWVHDADKDDNDALDFEEFVWWYTIGRKAESAERR